MSVNDHKNKSPAPGPSAPPAEDTQQQFTRERRKLRWTALGLLVLILLLLLRLGWLKLGGDDGKVVIPPDYPLITIDPDAKKTNDGQGKFTASQGGGKVALSYSTKLSYDMASGVVGLSFANPSSSTQAMVLQIIVYGGTNETTGKPDEYLLAESGVLPPGYYVEQLSATVEEGVTLTTGVYSGVMRVLFYNEETGEKAIVNTDIPVSITVS